jgi:hypothetical protein
MPKLLKNISACLVDDSIGNVFLIKNVKGEVQGEDYINLGGLIGYLQDFSKIETSLNIEKPLLFGLKNEKNIKVININIDY